MTTYSAPPVSPYDPSMPNLAPETPELEDLLRSTVLNAMRNTNVCMPAKIVAVSANQTVDLQLLPQTRYAANASATDKRIVYNVPVAMAVSGAYSVKLPIAVGDTGLAFFADRSLDNYLASDGTKTYDPADTRMHHLGDAVFLPGLPTTSQQTQDSTSDLVITNGKMQLRLRQDGKVQLKNGTQELLAILDQVLSNQLSLLQTLQTNTFTLTALGPQGFIATTITALAQLQSQLQTLQTNLETLKA